MPGKRFAIVLQSAKRFITAVGILVIALVGTTMAQDDTAAATQEPQYNGQFFALGAGGSLTPLEQTKMVHQMKSQNRFISVKVTGEDVVPNPASSVRLGPGARFVVRTGPVPEGVDPNTLISLKPFLVEKNQRAILKNSAGGYIFQSGKGQTAQDTSIELSFKKFGNNSMEVVPSKPLAPGEYVLMTHAGFQAVSCFGVDAGLSSPAPDNAGAAAKGVAGPTASDTGSPIWRIHPMTRDGLNEVYEATLPGLAEAKGKKGSALLAVRCTVQHFSNTAKTSGSIDAELRVRRNMVQFTPDPFGCTGDTDTAYNGFAHIRVGSGPETEAQFCSDRAVPADQNAVMSFGLGIDTSLVEDPSDAGPLNIRVRIADAGADDLSAKFNHAQNTSALKSMVDPCQQLITAARKAEEALVEVSCPVVDGKGLTEAEVLVGPAMKRLPPDPDNDVGVAWNLPKSSKTHVRPKLSLACGYKADAQLQDTRTKAERKLLPIPAAAAYCEFRRDGGKTMHASCSRDASTQ